MESGVFYASHRPGVCEDVALVLCQAPAQPRLQLGRHPGLGRRVQVEQVAGGLQT